LAQHGARVVVNDVIAEGDGPSATAVVDEITQQGGTAVAAVGSVADADDAQAAVATALEQFDRIDVVVNNAGILRDKSFAKTSEQQLRQVLDVHLVGTFLVTQAAWPHMKQQGYGRIINTTSPAGLFGSFGQANYSAAKAGIIGLTQTLAIEGARHGVLANVIAPLAATRMTETILPDDVLERLDPALASPVVAYLASEACQSSGEVITAGAGFVGRAAIVQGHGVALGDGLTPQHVADAWSDIRSLDTFHEFPGANEQSQWIVEGASQR
jgi:NAD(P)-dependent dehydrogenase (short-subunit alcohol dehydrogenase family)